MAHIKLVFIRKGVLFEKLAKIFQLNNTTLVQPYLLSVHPYEQGKAHYDGYTASIA